MYNIMQTIRKELLVCVSYDGFGCNYSNVNFLFNIPIYLANCNCEDYIMSCIYNITKKKAFEKTIEWDKSGSMRKGFVTYPIPHELLIHESDNAVKEFTNIYTENNLLALFNDYQKSITINTELKEFKDKLMDDALKNFKCNDNYCRGCEIDSSVEKLYQIKKEQEYTKYGLYYFN